MIGNFARASERPRPASATDFAHPARIRSAREFRRATPSKPRETNSGKGSRDQTVCCEFRRVPAKVPLLAPAAGRTILELQSPEFEYKSATHGRASTVISASGQRVRIARSAGIETIASPTQLVARTRIFMAGRLRRRLRASVDVIASQYLAGSFSSNSMAQNHNGIAGSAASSKLKRSFSVHSRASAPAALARLFQMAHVRCGISMVIAKKQTAPPPESPRDADRPMNPRGFPIPQNAKNFRPPAAAAGSARRTSSVSLGASIFTRGIKNRRLAVSPHHRFNRRRVRAPRDHHHVRAPQRRFSARANFPRAANDRRQRAPAHRSARYSHPEPIAGAAIHHPTQNNRPTTRVCCRSQNDRRQPRPARILAAACDSISRASSLRIFAPSLSSPGCAPARLYIRASKFPLAALAAQIVARSKSPSEFSRCRPVVKFPTQITGFCSRFCENHPRR